MRRTGERAGEPRTPSASTHASRHPRHRHFALVKLRARPSLGAGQRGGRWGGTGYGDEDAAMWSEGVYLVGVECDGGFSEWEKEREHIT